MSDEDGYEVGYGRPPKHSQFKKGQSGNPGGRPKGSATLKEVLAREAARHVQVTEAGRRTEATKLEAAAKALFQKAMKGDVAAGRLLQAVLASDPDETPTSAPRYALTDEDIAVMKSHADWLAVVEKARHYGGASGPGDEADQDNGEAG